jgi:UDP-GlcNAc:undecaprenyl-phosphate GlcNAc-1-phosphate transferase
VVAAVVVAGAANGVLTPLVTRLAHHFKWYDIPDSRKLHTGLIPRIGGLAIFLSIALGTSAGTAAMALLDVPLPEALPPLLAATAGVAMIFAVGLFDDFVPLRARVKLLLQIIAAAIIAAGGMRIDSISLPLFGRLELGLATVPVTVFWIVGMVNSVNLIDGRDGLAGGITAFAAAGLAVVALLQGHLLTAIAAVAVFGAVCGFLVYNWPPASIFMGDSGSHLLGFTLAVLPLLDIAGAATLSTLVVPVTLVLIPILDCGAAVLRRVRQRVSLGTADTDHIHFILRDLGLSDRKILLAVYSVCGYLAVVAITTTVLLRGAAIYLFVVSWAGVLLAYGILVALHAYRKQRRADSRFQGDAGSNDPRQA